MPRIKSLDQSRKRCSRACENCRRRKEKCEGREPCAGCTKRGLDCRFEQIDGSTASPAGPHPATSSQGTRPRRIESEGGQSTARSDASDYPRYISRGHSGTANAAREPITESAEDLSATEAPVPSVARMLRDGQGTFIYIGDSASLSFVQNVRRVVLAKVGECGFTNDDLRHSFLEHGPSDRQIAIDPYSPHGDEEAFFPTPDEVDMLLSQYITATSCFVDLFDNSDLSQNLKAWTTGRRSDDRQRHSIYYLVLAIGAQVTAHSGYDALADRLFGKAQWSLSASLTESPSIQTVQCYTLNAVFMLGACRRNSSFMNFGVAVRAAYALGLNRADLHPIFSEAEQLSRRRVWQSLRVLDLFLSASLGRPPSTTDSVGDSTSGALSPNSNESHSGRMMAAMVRLCEIFEKILLDVYRKRGVSINVANSISRLHRDWTSHLPPPPESPLDEAEYGSLSVDLSPILGWAHLTSAYHWSIILLTRPFLMFCVSSAYSNQSSRNAHKTNQEMGPSISTLADACIDSAISGINIAEELIRYPSLPIKIPFILNALFNCALAVGAAFFGDYDRSFPLNKGMDKAKRVLEYLSTHDPQARRYAQIVTFLERAIAEYLRSRDRLFLQESNKRKSELFGVIGSPHPRSTTRQVERPSQDNDEQSSNLHQTYSSTFRDQMPRPGSVRQSRYPVYSNGQLPSAHVNDDRADSRSKFTNSSGLLDPVPTTERDILATSQSLDSLARIEGGTDTAPVPYNFDFYDTVPIFNIFGDVGDAGPPQFYDHRNFVVPVPQ